MAGAALKSRSFPLKFGLFLSDTFSMAFNIKSLFPLRRPTFVKDAYQVQAHSIREEGIVARKKEARKMELKSKEEREQEEEETEEQKRKRLIDRLFFLD